MVLASTGSFFGVVRPGRKPTASAMVGEYGIRPLTPMAMPLSPAPGR
jgi:hypothetical protein